MTTNDTININNSDESIHLQEELSDLMIYCFSLANQLGIDIATAIDDKIEKNEIKYPVTQKDSSNR